MKLSAVGRLNGWKSLAELQGVVMSPELRKELFRAVNQLAASTDCAEQRTLSNFLLTLQDNRLREALEYYSLRGAAGRLLDAESDGMQADIFQVFELEHLMARGEKIVLPVLAYLFTGLNNAFRGNPPCWRLMRPGSCWATPHSGQRFANG